MRVGVVGAGGRMGLEVCRTLIAEPDLDLVAAVDLRWAGTDLGALTSEGEGIPVAGELDVLVSSGAEVVVDFTRIEAARTTVPWCAAAGIHVVVGTTGFTEADLAELGRAFPGTGVDGPNCILAPNFAIGAVLMMRFAELAARWFEGAEIVELHHDGKLDAPSGTSMLTAERMAVVRADAGLSEFPDDRTSTVMAEGARGARGPGGVRMHSVRLAGLVAHQEVILGSGGQGLTIRHDSYHRSSFMDGVVLAVRKVADRPGVTMGLEPLLGI